MEKRTAIKPGRPKGGIAPQSKRMLEAWDGVKRENPNLTTVALLNLVAETLYGRRINARVRKREIDHLKRTLQRHKKIGS